MRILAVDDDEIALDLLSSALRGAGYIDLVLVTSVAEALEKVAAAETPFDVFLLDIQMPGMNGIELCSELRSIPCYRSVPIVMITAMQERHFIDKAFAAGAVDYLNKPFDPIELRARLGIAERLVNQAQRVDESASQVAFLKSRSGIGTSFDVEEPVRINDVPRVISMTAMENYLLRLSYWMAVSSKSVVFSISGFRSLHANLQPFDAYDLLSDTAGAITDGLKHINHLVTYAGDGKFVAVVNGFGSALNQDTLWLIQSELDQHQTVLSTGRTCPITLQMGDVYSPNLWSAPNRLGLLLYPQTSVYRPTANAA